MLVSCSFMAARAKILPTFPYRIRGRYSVRNYIDEKIYGVASLESYATVLEAVDSDWGQFVLRLKKMRDVSECAACPLQHRECMYPHATV